GGDLERVRNVGIAGIAHLLAVRTHGVDVGAVEQILVGLGIVLLDPVDQLVLPHQLRLACGRRHPPRRRLTGLRHQIRGARHCHAERRLGVRLRQVHRVRHSRFLAVRGGLGACAATAMRRSRLCPPANCADSAEGHNIMGRCGRHKARTTPGAGTQPKPRAESSPEWCNFVNDSAAGTLPFSRAGYSSSSTGSGSGSASGGVRPSRPLSSSSSLIRSVVTSVSSASIPVPGAPISGMDSGSGSSTSTYFCSEWTSSSWRSSGEIAVSAIWRSATTGFLSLSRWTAIWARDDTMRARWAASRTSSKRFSTLSMQSSTVTRAMWLVLLDQRSAGSAAVPLQMQLAQLWA